MVRKNIVKMLNYRDIKPAERGLRSSKELKRNEKILKRELEEKAREHKIWSEQERIKEVKQKKKVVIGVTIVVTLLILTIIGMVLNAKMNNNVVKQTIEQPKELVKQPLTQTQDTQTNKNLSPDMQQLDNMLAGIQNSIPLIGIIMLVVYISWHVMRRNMF